MVNKFLSNLLKYILYATFVAGVALTVSVPFMIENYILFFYDSFNSTPYYQNFIVVFLIIIGILCLWIVAELISMIRTLPLNPFIMSNAKSLRRMGFVALTVAAMFLLKCCLFFTVITAACAGIMFVCSLFSFTLYELFKQSVLYKEENDLTI